MPSKFSIQFSIDGWSCVPSLLFTWGQTMVEVMKIMVSSFKRLHACMLHSVPPILQQATTNPQLHWRLLDTHKQVMGQSPMGSLFPSPGSLCTRFCLFPPRVFFTVLCKFWQLYGGLMATSSKRANGIPKSAVPRASVPARVHY